MVQERIAAAGEQGDLVQSRAPMLEALEAYWESEPASFSIPAHKGGRSLDETTCAILGAISGRSRPTSRCPALTPPSLLQIARGGGAGGARLLPDVLAPHLGLFGDERPQKRDALI